MGEVVKDDWLKTVHICNFVTGQWKYDGWYFEFHSYCGPTRLHKSKHTPLSSNPPDAFWRMWERFDKLPKAEKDKYAVDYLGRKR